MIESTETPPEPSRSVRELQSQFDADVRRVAELRQKVRARKATGYEVREFTDTARRAIATRDELRDRTAERVRDEHGRGILWKLGRRGHPLTRAREIEGRVLDGVDLDHGNLTDDEIGELRKLLKVRHREEETPEESARFEDLIGKAAGETGLYARRRSEITKEDEMKAEIASLARVFMPVRRDPEPGSVELPRFVFEWLTKGQPDTFDVTDLGLLAALVFSFSNESAALFRDARFEGVGDDPRIIVGKGSAGGIRLTAGADDTQRVQVRVHLATLARNGWADVQTVRGVTTIRPGERMRKLWPKARG